MDFRLSRVFATEAKKAYRGSTHERLFGVPLGLGIENWRLFYKSEYECQYGGPYRGRPLAGFVKWAQDSSLSRSTFFSSPLFAFRDEKPDSRLGLPWNRCRLPTSETHQSPIRIKAWQIGDVFRSGAPGTYVPQKFLSARRLSMPKAHKSCGFHRERNIFLS